MRAKRYMNLKKTAIVLSVVLAMLVGVAGTLAYLKDSTAPVTNTFTAGDVTISLVEKEITYAADGTWSYAQSATAGVTNNYVLIPGVTYTKDPVVSVAQGSEKCYLFIKVEENANNKTYLDYTLNLTGWTELDANSGVYYRVVEKNAQDRSWNLIVDDKITVKPTVTKANMDAAKTASLIITAYAIQWRNDANGGFEPAEAWAEVKNNP